MTGSQPTRRSALGVVAGLAILPASATLARAPRTHTIVMARMRFGPTPPGIRVGDTILWVNQDMFRHTATARNDAFDVDLARGESGRAVMRTAGGFAYFCRFHPGMTGVVEVSR